MLFQGRVISVSLSKMFEVGANISQARRLADVLRMENWMKLKLVLCWVDIKVNGTLCRSDQPVSIDNFIGWGRLRDHPNTARNPPWCLHTDCRGELLHDLHNSVSVRYWPGVSVLS